MGCRLHFCCVVRHERDPFYLTLTRRSKLCIACSDFLQNSERAHAAASPLRKKSRSAHLLSCKRPRDGSLSLPTFCGFKSTAQKWGGISFATSWQSRASIRNSRSGLCLWFYTCVYNGHFLRRKSIKLSLDIICVLDSVFILLVFIAGIFCSVHAKEKPRN